MFSEEGGVCTVSSSIRRVRSRLDAFGRFVARAAGRGFGFDARAIFRGRAVLRAVFRLGRLAEARFFADFAGFGRLAAVRLAMSESFRNLDSLAISVVRSVAYRNSGK